MWVWPSMKPGVTTWPSASISRAPRSRMRPTNAMRSPRDADVGAERPQTRAVDDGPVADHQVVGNTVILLAVRATSSEIRARLPHPVIDIDGHMAEYFPALAPYLEREGLSLDHPSLQRMLPPDGGSDRTWHEQSPAERAATRTPRGPWWSSPAKHDRPRDRALPRPALRAARRAGLRRQRRVPEPRAGVPPHPRRALSARRVPRAEPRNAETFAALGDRLVPVAAIPMHTPEEAVDELDYAVTTLGFKAVLCAGYVQRPFDALADQPAEVTRYAFWLDQFGIDHRTTTTRCGPRRRSSACRSRSTRGSSA